MTNHESFDTLYQQLKLQNKRREFEDGVAKYQRVLLLTAQQKLESQIDAMLSEAICCPNCGSKARPDVESLFFDLSEELTDSTQLHLKRLLIDL